MPAAKPFRAVHIGDLHFWRIPLNPFLYFNKRLLGVGNLIVGGRGKKFRQHMAPDLVTKLKNLNPDAFLFSGDFTSTSAPGEFVAARNTFAPAIAVAPLGAYSVPGNHDCYLGRKIEPLHFRDRLGDAFRPTQHIDFSFIHEEVALFQINATTKNGFGSHGRVTSEHLAAMKGLSRQIHNVKMVWFLCHFPAEDPPGVLRHDRGPQLMNCAPLLDFFASLPVKVLWLHGHHHHRWIYGSPTVPNLAYLNAGAPFLRRGTDEPDLGFHELNFDGEELKIACHAISKKEGAWDTRDVSWPAAGEYVDLQTAGMGNRDMSPPVLPSPRSP
ncbi:hypothetical protein BH09SUM1_BH09SUM1_08000 [soil metagenome]